MKNIGNNLRKAREKAGLSQHALAKLSGFSQGQISILELNYRPPTKAISAKLSKVLGCPIEKISKEVKSK